MKIEEKKIKSLIIIHRKKDVKIGRDFNLTIEWWLENIAGKECVYCGTINNIGVDRIDNSIGHVKSNCHSVCKNCNSIKGNWRTHNDMIEFRKLVDSIGFYEARLKTIKNKEEIELVKRDWRLKNKDLLNKKKRDRYLEDKEKILERKRKYRLKNKDLILEYNKKYRLKNKNKG